MANSNPFGTRSTADKVLAGVDLTGRRIVVTGCNSGLGFETMSALSANGAIVIGLARSLQDARAACGKVAPSCIPVACDLADLDSVAAAADTIRALQGPLDAIVANAGIANLPTLQIRSGVEMQFLVNHVGHFALVNRLSNLVRNGTGRIVIVSSRAGINQAPPEGIMFDNLDGRRFYKPFMFYGQSKLANALFAKELSRRLIARGIAVNSVHPGATHRPQQEPIGAAKTLPVGGESAPEIGAAGGGYPGVAGREPASQRNHRRVLGKLSDRHRQPAARGSRTRRAALGCFGGHRLATRCLCRKTTARSGLNAVLGQGLSCARISPGLCSALWTLTYKFPALKLAYCSSVSLDPAGTDHTPAALLSSVMMGGPLWPGAPT
jgi:WW domain-containing oxidoreductase